MTGRILTEARLQSVVKKLHREAHRQGCEVVRFVRVAVQPSGSHEYYERHEFLTLPPRVTSGHCGDHEQIDQLPETEFHRAAFFDCSECGKEQFHRSRRYTDEELRVMLEVDTLLPSHEVHRYEFPRSAVCGSCGVAFRVAAVL